MSIIPNTLKKAGKQQKKEKFLQDSVLIRELDEDRISARRKKRIWSLTAKSLMYIGSFVLIGLFLFGMGYLFYSHRNKNNTSDNAKSYDPKSRETPVVTHAPTPIQTHLPTPRSAEFDRPGDFGIKLDGVMWDDQNPKVMFNDKILGVGESFNDMVIVNITKDHVTVKLHGNIYKFQY
jgi:hypothetical protein